MRLIKSSTKKSPSKTRPKDKRSPIQPLKSTDTTLNKKTFQDKQKPTTKQKIQNSETIEIMNKFRILEKMEPESSQPKLTKPKTQKNKPTNSPEQRTNNEPPNNSVELPRLNTIKNIKQNNTMEL